MRDEADDEEAPKLFISYSWTNQEHIDWVIALATELRRNGVDVILDKWRLKEGYDAHAFMEQIVTSPGVRKVAIICDAVYVEKSRKRSGGVGAESQIMSGELYGKVDQDKFVAIALHKDENGRVALPIFMNQRIFIDFTNSSNYHGSLEQLIRWCFDKPFHVEPELGSRPSFLENSSATIVRQQTIFDSTVRGRESLNIPSIATSDFFRSISVLDAVPSVNPEDDQPLYDSVYNGMIGAAPLLRRVLDVFRSSVEKGEKPEQVISNLHGYLEFLVGQYGKGKTDWSDDLLRFYTHFLFVSSVAILIDNQALEEIDNYLSTHLVVDGNDGLTAKAYSFTHIRQPMRSLEARNDARSLNRLSLHADVVKQVCEATEVSFRSFLQADLFLYIRAYFKGSTWWPISLVYASSTYGAFPCCARLESQL